MSTRPLDPLIFGSEQTCFGCGPHNDRGWKLHFAIEDDTVVTRFTPEVGQEGPPGIFHGGLQATLMDELAGWTLVGLREAMGFTSSMRVRYIRPIRIGQEIVARGRISAEEGNTATVKTTLEQDGKIGCRATITYALPDRETAHRTLGQTQLPEMWLKFCRD